VAIGAGAASFATHPGIFTYMKGLLPNKIQEQL